jgi:hypothetical protein
MPEKHYRHLEAKLIRIGEFVGAVIVPFVLDDLKQFFVSSRRDLLASRHVLLWNEKAGADGAVALPQGRGEVSRGLMEGGGRRY